MQRGILGGTFDPPHLAHLVAAESAYRDLHLDAVTLLPAGAPWQKAHRRVTGAEHRWRMAQLAVEGVDYLDADEREVRRQGWTYTADTLDGFPPDEQITLILGADAARGLPTWHRYRDVLDRASIAVVPRPGTERHEVEAAVGDVRWLDTPELALSGTMLRARVRAGRSVRFLVPERVWAYIVDHSLYLDGPVVMSECEGE